MSAEVFLDTNVFIYQVEGTDSRKSTITERLVHAGIATGGCCTSFQVVQESLNTVLRKAEIGLDEVLARVFLNEVLAPLCTVFPSIGLYESALDLRHRYRFHFYDSLIVAAALEAGCSRLLSEDFQHGQRIDTLVIEDPFRS